MKIRVLLAHCGLMLLVIAQPTLAQEICRDIITYAARDLTSTNTQDAVSYSIYSEHCEGSSLRQSGQTNIGLEAVVKAVPVKFNLGSGSAEQKLQQFCKIYSQTGAASSVANIQTSLVVREALTAFNDCIMMANRGVHFIPTIQRAQVAVSVRRAAGQDVNIQGVRYRADVLKCDVPNTDTRNGTQVADLNTRKKLGADFYPIFCERIGIPNANGGLNYPRAELSILTDQGNFAMPIAPDAEMPVAWASEISNNIGRLRENTSTDFGSLRSRIGALENRVRALETNVGKLAWNEQNIGPSNIGGRGEIRTTVKLSRTYSTPPLVLVTTQAHPNDFVPAIVTGVRANEFDVWAFRVNGGPFAASVILRWIEISKD
jgi:hypothetical protein